MKWIAVPLGETAPLAGSVFGAAISPSYFSTANDPRAMLHLYASFLPDLVEPSSFGEETSVVFEGPSAAATLLQGPHNPVRMALSAVLTRVANLEQVEGSSSAHARRKVSLAITAYNQSELVEGTPLASRVARGLGLVGDETTGWDRTVRLSFGERRGAGHHVELQTAVDGDSIVAALLNSLSFQRHLPSMTLHVRITTAQWCDAVCDSDELPHYMNEGIVSLWFVSARHSREFIGAVHDATARKKAVRFPLGISLFSTRESCVKAAEFAGNFWSTLVHNGVFLPTNPAGKHVQAGGADGGLTSPRSKDLEQTHTFVVAQRRRALELTAAYTTAPQPNGSPAREPSAKRIDALRSELKRLGESYDAFEKTFTEAVEKLETEQKKFAETEAEIKDIRQEISISKGQVLQNEETRKQLLSCMTRVSSLRDELSADLTKMNDLEDRQARERATANEALEKTLIAEAVQREEEYDHHLQLMTAEEKQARADAFRDADALMAEIQTLQAELQSSENAAEEELVQKKADLALSQKRLAKLKSDREDASTAAITLRDEIVALTAEATTLRAGNQSSERFEASVSASRDELSRMIEKNRMDEEKLESLLSKRDNLAAALRDMEAVLLEEVSALYERIEETVAEAEAVHADEIETMDATEALARTTIEEMAGEAYYALQLEYLLGAEDIKASLQHKASQDWRQELENQLTTTKSTITSLTYEQMQVDDDIARLEQHIEASKITKADIRRDLEKNLEEILAERDRLLTAMPGGGSGTFPLLDTQREVLQEKMQLLKTCMSLPILLDTRRSSSEMSTSSSVQVPSAFSTERLLTKEVLEDELQKLHARLERALELKRAEEMQAKSGANSLREKMLHLDEEHSIKGEILKNLDMSEHELKSQIISWKNEIAGLNDSLAKMQQSTQKDEYVSGMLLKETSRQQQKEMDELRRRRQEASARVEALQRELNTANTRLAQGEEKLVARRGELIELRKVTAALNEAQIENAGLNGASISD